MSTDSTESGGKDGPAIGPCANAEEYAVEFLEQHDGAAKPSMIAEEYDCTPGHMQDVLRESDEIVRVDHGEYALSTQTDTGAEATGNGVDSESEAANEAVGGAAEGDRQTPRPQSGGQALSLATDTTDPESQDGDDLVPTDEEYERQQAELYGSDDGDDQDSDESEAEPVEVVEEDVSMGIPVPMDARKLMLLVSVGALLFILWRAGQPSEPDSDSSESSSDVETESARVESSGSGLVSGGF